VNTGIELASKFDSAPFVFPGEVGGGVVGIVGVTLRMLDGIVVLRLLDMLAKAKDLNRRRGDACGRREWGYESIYKLWTAK